MSEDSEYVRAKCDNHPDREYSYCPGDKKLCAACYVQQYNPISFVYHRDVLPWVKELFDSEAFNKKLIETWRWNSGMPYMDIHVFSRKEAEEIQWHNRWACRGYDNELRAHTAPYSYRAWCDYWNNYILLLTDDTETPESLEWVFWHELAHAACRAAPLFEKAMSKKNRANNFKSGDAHKNDELHEMCAEEQFVNEVATAMMDGKFLNRIWWRQRVNAHLANVEAEKTLSSQADGDE